MSTATQGESLFQTFKKFILMPFDKALLQTVPEIAHLSPVIFIFATGFLALTTLNSTLGYFSASSAEAYLIANFFTATGQYLVTPTNGVVSQSSTGVACKSTFQTLTPTRFRYLMGEGVKEEFPHMSLYFLSFAAAYILQGLNFFSQEIQQLGPQYSSRPQLALLGAVMIILLYTLYLIIYGCSSTSSLLFSLALGIFVGVMIAYQNYLLFGKTSVNMLFVPPIARRKGMDYICVTAAGRA
jgi:hypothetical protein